MFLMLQSITKSKKGNYNKELICKVCYIPAVITKYMYDDLHSAKELFSYLGSDVKTIVKCYFRDGIESQVEVDLGESNERRLLLYGLNSIHKVFEMDNLELSKTLFIFNHITFEALSFVLLSKGYTLHGGTHTRRHLLTPLDLTLAFSIKNIFNYVNESRISDLIKFNTAPNGYVDYMNLT